MINVIEHSIEDMRIEAGLTVGENANAVGSKTQKIRILANSGEDMPDWKYGKRIYNLEGYKVHKAKLAIDDCHNDYVIVGHTTRDSLTDEGLILDGLLTGRNEKSCEYIGHLEDGTPLEASITSVWEKVVILDSDIETYEVNGRIVEGPAVIVVEWSLRGVAICPYGNDKNANVTAVESADKQIYKIPVIGGTDMKEENAETPAVEAVDSVDESKVEGDAVEAEQVETKTEESIDEAPASEVEESEAVEVVEAEEVQEVEADQAEDVQESKPEPKIADLAKPYLEAFGVEKGSVYFAKGLSVEDAYKADNADKAEQIKNLNAKLEEASKESKEQKSAFRFDGIAADLKAESLGEIKPVFRFADGK